MIKKQNKAIKVPMYGKRNKCIDCGSNVASKSSSHTKKGIPAGFRKSLEMWLNYQILIDKYNHFFCLSCFELNSEIPSKYSDNIDHEYLLRIITKSFKKIEKL